MVSLKSMLSQKKLACAVAVIAGFFPIGNAQERKVDTAKSVVTIEVKKAGVLSAFGHDHEIGAPLAGGSVDAKGRKVELRWNASALRVYDKGISDKDRAEIQSTMLGPDVLDAEHYREVVFRSTNAEPGGSGVWNVRGDLTLHNQTRPVMAEVREANGHYTAMLRIRQTDFGIKPVKVAGGTVRVKDEVQIMFDIQLAP
jgi:polyisoprenoid-binding protein YceI